VTQHPDLERGLDCGRRNLVAARQKFSPPPAHLQTLPTLADRLQQVGQLRRDLTPSGGRGKPAALHTHLGPMLRV
jgi:hypothetical protein